MPAARYRAQTASSSAHSGYSLGKARELDASQRDSTLDMARLIAITVERNQLKSHLRQEAEDLRESEKRMALAIAGSGTGIWDRNIQANEIHYSDGLESAVGLCARGVST